MRPQRLLHCPNLCLLITRLSAHIDVALLKSWQFCYRKYFHFKRCRFVRLSSIHNTVFSTLLFQKKKSHSTDMITQYNFLLRIVMQQVYENLQHVRYYYVNARQTYRGVYFPQDLSSEVSDISFISFLYVCINKAY